MYLIYSGNAAIIFKISSALKLSPYFLCPGAGFWLVVVVLPLESFRFWKSPWSKVRLSIGLWLPLLLFLLPSDIILPPRICFYKWYHKIRQKKSTHLSTGAFHGGYYVFKARHLTSNLRITFRIRGDALHTWNVWVENPETRYFRCTGSLQHIIYPLSDITDSGISPKRQPPTLRRLDLNQWPSGYEPDELPGCFTPRTKTEGFEPTTRWLSISCSAI